MKRMSLLFFAFVVSTPVAAASAEAQKKAPIAVPFLSQYCVKCHNDSKHRGDVQLNRLTLKVDDENAKLWKEIVHNIQRGNMPPAKAQQPSAETRRKFLAQILPLLERYEADKTADNDPLMRLTNRQIAHSLQDLLHISRDISGNLIEDPVDKHGYSIQSELTTSASFFGLYLPQLRLAVADAIPDLGRRLNVFRVVGNDWEKQHYLCGWSLSQRSRRNIYRGPKWLGDKFQIPLPPQHEFRMYLKDNRPEGEFRIRIRVRNEPPTSGGKATPQKLSVYLDEGAMRPYKLVGNITVPVKKGTQQFDLFGNVRDWVGVRQTPVKTGPATRREQRKRIASYRILSVQNNNVLTGFPPPVRTGGPDRTGNVYLVRPDDQWIAAFGNLPGLKPSYRGPAGAHPGKKGKTKAIYPEVMKKFGHVIIERIEFELPYLESWPPRSIQPFLTKGKLNREDLPAKLKAFAAKAWRRPLDADLRTYVDQVLAKEFAAGCNELEALRNALTIILADPKFLYLTRTGKTTRARNLELVSRLAYFLWDGPPDAKLLALANRDQALDDKTILAEVDRLLAAPKSRRFVESFVSLWIGFKQLDQIAIDPNYFPKWRPTLVPHIKNESVAFFEELLRNDLSCLNLLDSDFVVINKRLADHYGIKGVNGNDFSRVKAPDDRGGVLTQAAFLLAYSNGQDAHAVNRGVWLRARLLGDPPRDPPPDVPALADQNESEVDFLSISQRLAKHRVGTCYDCHRNIDPWGVAMEGFGPTGMPRKQVLRITRNGGRKYLPVDSTAEIDGHKIDGMKALRKYLVTHRRNDFAKAFTQHMLSYALGRRLTYRDQDQVAAIQKTFQENSYRMRALIKAIVTSPVFRGRQIKEKKEATRNAK